MIIDYNYDSCYFMLMHQVLVYICLNIHVVSLYIHDTVRFIKSPCDDLKEIELGLFYPTDDPNSGDIVVQSSDPSRKILSRKNRT